MAHAYVIAMWMKGNQKSRRPYQLGLNTPQGVFNLVEHNENNPEDRRWMRNCVELLSAVLKQYVADGLLGEGQETGVWIGQKGSVRLVLPEA